MQLNKVQLVLAEYIYDIPNINISSQHRSLVNQL